MIRIMVADDHAGFRAGLRALLATAGHVARPPGDRILSLVAS